jgi:hypothetical protein
MSYAVTTWEGSGRRRKLPGKSPMKTESAFVVSRKDLGRK